MLKRKAGEVRREKMGRTTYLTVPTVRRSLLRIHRDLFTIDEFVAVDQSGGPLNLVERMVLVLEDRRYFLHNGFDIVALARETFKAITFQRHGGASTVDMQLVRTATGYRQRSLRRKLYEILLARLIQYRYSKLDILRGYLSRAYFGSGIFGVEQASYRMYGKHVIDLTEAEAAAVASLLVYPRPQNPTPQWFLKVSRRANYARRIFPRLEQRFHQIPSGKLL